jgi:serine/threonine protein kinase
MLSSIMIVPLDGPILQPGEVDGTDLLKEAELMMRLESPHIIRPAYIVRDAYHNFRGYLTPFHRAGNLTMVLNSSQRPYCHDVALPIDDLGAYQLQRQFLLPETKMQWAIEIAGGVADLHARGVHCGDIKLTNVVLQPDGHVCLIDVAPTSGWTAEYLAPEYDREGRRDQARDVFALGLVLWSLWEEVPRFEQMNLGAKVTLPWHEGTSLELVDLVESCICPEPDKRPSASSILKSLRKRKDAIVPDFARLCNSRT